jgi:predicted TPR repeat methyltransferase
VTFDPDRLDALHDRARRAERRGNREAAARLYRECLAMDPDDHCGVTLRLAALGLAAPASAPAAYVATLFDQIADDFDDILVGRLGYGVPALARALVGRHAAGPFRMLDLGCGTGLAGLAFADVAADITGVDLSEAILAHADVRGVYGDLYVAEAVAFLAGWDEAPFSLIVATDVLPYLGDLAPFARAAAATLAPGGLLVASTERRDEGWGVTGTQRFSHATAYLAAVLTAAGCEVLEIEPIVVRHEEGIPVDGDLVLARLTSASVAATAGGATDPGA